MMWRKCLGLAGLIASGMLLTSALARAADQASESDLPVKAQLMKITDLGMEHFPTVAYRRGRNGPRIALWGDNRVVEFPIEANAPVATVVPFIEGLRRPPTKTGEPCGFDWRTEDWIGYSNGGCAIDVNGDGIDELVLERAVNNKPGTDLYWFEEVPGQKTWKEHFAGHQNQGKNYLTHDIEPFQQMVQGKLVKGVITGLNWKQPILYIIPDDPTQPWIEKPVSPPITKGSAYWGTATGDIAGKGRTDFAYSLYWAEAPADPLAGDWKLHRFADPNKGWNEEHKNPAWNTMLKDAVADMDGDGKLDIIVTEGEAGKDAKRNWPDGRLSIFRQPADNTGYWEETNIARDLHTPHSLVVTDVNGDGKPDIIVAEMTAGWGELKMNDNPKLFLYLNQGNLKFKKYVLNEGIGVHEMRMAPRKPGDKNVFVFSSDEIQPWYFGKQTTHIVGWTITPNN